MQETLPKISYYGFRRYDEGITTPWGESQGGEIVFEYDNETKEKTRVLERHYTAGHGGVKVYKDYQKYLPKGLRKTWLEEDCEFPAIAWMPRDIFKTFYETYSRSAISDSELDLVIKDWKASVLSWLPDVEKPIKQTLMPKLEVGMFIKLTTTSYGFTGETPNTVFQVAETGSRLRFYDKRTGRKVRLNGIRKILKEDNYTIVESWGS